MTLAEVKVNGVPLKDVNWTDQPKAFGATQGETTLLFTHFSSDYTGKLWNIESSDGQLSSHLTIFCLDIKPEEWKVIPVRTPLPSKPTIDLIERIIADAQQKKASFFNE